MAYNTNNPVGSTDPRDLYENAGNLDNLVNGDAPFYPDRFGSLRLSYAGMEQDFENAQSGREAEFQQFLADSAFVFIGDYAAGLNFTNRSQYLIRDGVPYRIAPSTTLPYLTTGNWTTEQSKFTPISSDDILRQELSSGDIDKGAFLVSRASRSIYSVQEFFGLIGIYEGERVNLLSYWTDQFMNGSSVYLSGENIGGGALEWDPTMPRSRHNGVTVFSPTVPAPGIFSSLQSYLSGTGETAPSANGCWVRAFSGHINLAAAGCVQNDATKDNRYAMSAIMEVVGSRAATGQMPEIHLPIGDIYYSASPNWGKYSGLRIKGPGAGACRLKYTGAGHSFEIRPAEFDMQFRYGYSIEGFLIDAGPQGASGLYVENVAQSMFKDVWAINGSSSAILFNLRLAVLCNFDTCGVTVNRWAVSSIHSEGLRLSASPSKLLSSTACTFVNCTWEGASLAGVRAVNADNVSFYGGASEANSGRGVLIASACRSLQFFNFALEANAISDVLDEGQLSHWSGGYSISSGGFTIGGPGRMNRVEGMYTNNFAVTAGAVGVSLRNLDYNHLGTGSFTDNGTATEKINIRDRTSGSLVYNKKSRQEITVSASPFTYTNNSGQWLNILIRGGTVSRVQQTRGGDTWVVGDSASSELTARNGYFMVPPGDSLVVTYSVVPAMNSVPMGTNAV